LTNTFLSDKQVFSAVFVPITNMRPGIIGCLNIYTVRLKMTGICQLTSGRAPEKGKITVAFTDDQIEIAVFIPVANCDCCTLTSAITDRYVDTVGLEINVVTKSGIIMSAGIRVKPDLSAIILTKQQILFTITIPVNDKRRCISSGPHIYVYAIRLDVYRIVENRGLRH
jgi:hypothetical protein